MQSDIDDGELLMFSHSRYTCYKTCPRQYYYRYILHLKGKPITKPSDPRILGTVMHHAIQNDLEDAWNVYKEAFCNMVTDEMITNMIVIEYWSNQLRPMFLEAQKELMVKDDKFIGYVDLYDKGKLWDIKYASKPTAYYVSSQLMLYKHLMDGMGMPVESAEYLFIPKISPRKGKDEDVNEYRVRLLDAVKKLNYEFIECNYNEELVKNIYDECDMISGLGEDIHAFHKHPCGLCENFCDYRTNCEEDE